VKVVEPIWKHLPMDQFGKIEGYGIVTRLAVLLLVFVSFVAGILARTGGGARITAWFETSFLGGLPQYEMMKSMTTGLAQIEGSGNPVLR
jgi:hypothetical protein